jgi:hypothetical protein
VELLCHNVRLKEVHLIQNVYTETALPVERQAWAKAKFSVYFR